MNSLKIAMASSAILIAAGCAQKTSEPGAGDGDTDGACPIIDTRNWEAWIDKMPGPDGGMRLHITGDADMPTPGYTFQWSEGFADRALPPGLRFKLTATPPDGIVAQVITTEQVNYSGETPYREIRAVYVSCGDKKLAEISPVSVVE